jgi:hypothetical protein
MRIFLQNLRSAYYRRFNLCNIEVFLQTLLLRVEADFVVASSYELLDLLKIHEAWYKKLYSTSSSNTHAALRRHSEAKGVLYVLFLPSLEMAELFIQFFVNLAPGTDCENLGSVASFGRSRRRYEIVSSCISTARPIREATARRCTLSPRNAATCVLAQLRKYANTAT